MHKSIILFLLVVTISIAGCRKIKNNQLEAGNWVFESNSNEGPCFMSPFQNSTIFFDGDHLYFSMDEGAEVRSMAYEYNHPTLVFESISEPGTDHFAQVEKINKTTLEISLEGEQCFSRFIRR